MEMNCCGAEAVGVVRLTDAENTSWSGGNNSQGLFETINHASTF